MIILAEVIQGYRPSADFSVAGFDLESHTFVKFNRIRIDWGSTGSNSGSRMLSAKSKEILIEQPAYADFSHIRICSDKMDVGVLRPQRYEVSDQETGQLVCFFNNENRVPEMDEKYFQHGAAQITAAPPIFHDGNDSAMIFRDSITDAAALYI